MSKRALHKITAVFAMAFALLFICAFSFVNDAYADDGYTYTVRIYAGNQGTIDGGDVKVYTGLKAGDRIPFDPASVTLKDDSKYYVSGIRRSGADNFDPENPQTPVITVKGDEDYVVAYGILGKSVRYTVRFRDAEGKTLATPQSYYGNVGDKPIIAFSYIDGYYPQAYSLTKTLSEDESQNVFDFIYTSTADTETVITETDNGAVTVAQNGGAGGAGAGAANADGTEIADNDTPQAEPQEMIDLDDGDVPTTDAADTESKTGVSPVVIGAGVVALAAIAGLAIAFARRRREEEN